ncbi:MAG TPA: glycosyltransferase family 4 protein [Thermoanaerobaculia bacterium]|nr:glycosyltransferase family 4 protein [Thermoanaerobaculia bacterium]
MKVLYICADLGIPVLGRKGAATHVRNLVAALQRSGHTVVVVAPSAMKSPFEEPDRLAAARLLTLPPGNATVKAVISLKETLERFGVESALPGDIRRLLYDQELFPKLFRRFKDDPPDIIYERGAMFGSAGARLAAALGRPLLLELNAPLSLEQTAYRHGALGDLAAEAERWTLSKADAVLAVSAPLADHVASLGTPVERIHVLPNGVDPSIFHPGPPDPATRSRWGLDGGPVLGFVGGFRPWHGVEFLPPLFEKLARRHEGLQLVIVGNGPLKSATFSEISKLGLASRTVLTGAIPQGEIPPLLREFAAALAPYPRPEHPFYFSPLKLFEYMACGAPVVASAIGQIAEVVQDGKTGFLCPPGDLDAFEAACNGLLSDPSLRRSVGEAAAREVAQHYTWDANARRVCEIARALIESRAKES